MEKICIKNMGEKHSFEKKIKPRSHVFSLKTFSSPFDFLFHNSLFATYKHNCVLFLYL